MDSREKLGIISKVSHLKSERLVRETVKACSSRLVEGAY